MISVPYPIEVNDVVLCVGRNLSGENFYRLVMDQLEGLLAAGEHTGQVMSIGVHPFILGQPFRLKYLDRVLREIAATKEVWATTSDEIAERSFTQSYDSAIASLHTTNAAASAAGCRCRRVARDVTSQRSGERWVRIERPTSLTSEPADEVLPRLADGGFGVYMRALGK